MTKEDNIVKKPSPVKWAIKLILGLSCVAFLYHYLKPFFSLEVIQSHQQLLKQFVAEYRLLSYLLYLTVFVVATSITLPTMTLLTLLCGFLFDFPTAIVLISLSFMTHTATMFISVRYFFRDVVSKKFNTAIKKINKQFDEKGVFYIIFLRMSLVIPPWLINCACALTSINGFVFVLVSWLASMPILMIVLYAGRLLGEIQTLSEIYSIKILGALLTLAFISALPLLISRKKNTK